MPDDWILNEKYMAAIKSGADSLREKGEADISFVSIKLVIRANRNGLERSGELINLYWISRFYVHTSGCLHLQRHPAPSRSSRALTRWIATTSIPKPRIIPPPILAAVGRQIRPETRSAPHRIRILAASVASESVHEPPPLSGVCLRQLAPFLSRNSAGAPAGNLPSPQRRNKRYRGRGDPRGAA